MKLLLLVFITLLCSASVTGKTGYAVFAPEHAEPGETYTVNVLLTKEAADTAVTSVTVQASLNITDVASQQYTVGFTSRQLGANATFRFAVPASLASGSVRLSVTSTGHIEFSKQIDVLVQDMLGQIYVQMDKPMYRAGDKVRFIVFGLYNNFQPVTDRPMNISVEDARRNLVQSWTNIRNRTSHGVAQYELLLSSRASLGKWRINVTFGEIKGFYEFPVEDYQLTYFEALLNVNSSYIPRYFENYTVEVMSEGRYQHSCSSTSSCTASERGQVVGRVEMQVWLLGTGSIKHGSINITKNVGPGEPATYLITSAALSEMVNISLVDRLLIYTKVIEAGTGLTNYANKTVPLIDSIYLLDYPKYVNPTVFIYPEDLYLHMMVLRADGLPLTSAETKDLRSEHAASCDAAELENDEEFQNLPSHTISRVRSNGAVNITIDTSELRCTTLNVKVKLVKFKTDLLFDSVTNQFSNAQSQLVMKISWEDGKYDLRQFEPGDQVSFVVKSESIVPAFHWMVVSRGLVFESNFISSQNLQNEICRFDVSPNHMPRATIIVWTTLNDELVADALEFLVVDNTVTLDYSTGSSPATDNFGSNAVTQVRSPVALRFDTLPSSFVQWLAIDEKMLIHLQSQISAGALDQSQLQGNNDFTPYTSKSLQQNFLDVSRQLSEHLDLLAGVHKDSAANTYQVFAQNEIILETSYSKTTGLPNNSNPVTKFVTADTNAVRVLIPDVFLFDNDLAPSSGSFIKRYTTPDTMTTWFVAALSLHPTRGVQVSNVVQIPVYHDFYLSIYIPTLTYKCNETVNATVYVHNTRNVDVSATLTTTGTANYKVEGRDVNVSVSKSVFVPAKSVVITTFLLQFVLVGRQKLAVRAVTADGQLDALETYVDVKPEGLAIQEDVTAFYCWNTTDCSTKIVLQPKKECCTQSVQGEMFAVITPVLMLPEDAGGEGDANNLPNPDESCEEMMPGFTDLSYLLRTLRRDNKTSSEVHAVATERIQVLLQYYLSKCARPDGSVTSWGNEYSYLGSTVLTSFVARTLVVAGDLVQDSGALDQAKRSINWLLSHQYSEGYFPPYPPNGHLTVRFVWYKHLETGPYANSIATAYALIGILEHETVGPQYADSHRDQLLLASSYLDRTYTSTDDIHYLSITAYALQLAAFRLNDAVALSASTAILNRLKPLAYSSNGKTFWPYNRTSESCNAVLTGATSATAIEVELAAFVFEINYLNVRVNDATYIFRFLLGQRNSQHKLPRISASSHSTALGQQAIGDYLLLGNVSVSCSGTIKLKSVTDSTQYSETITVYEDSLSPIEISLPPGISELEVTSNAGMTQVYIKIVNYYQNPYHAYYLFHSGVLETHVSASPTTDKHDFATIKICNSWNRNEPSGMIISMVELPSGYALHSTLIDLLRQHPTADGGSMVGNLETYGDKNLAIYYNFLHSYQPVCTEVLLRRTAYVENLATAAVRTYSGYETQFIALELYKLSREPHLPSKHPHGV